MKFCPKWFEVLSLEHFAADTRLFQVKKFFSKKLLTLSEEAWFFRTKSEIRMGHKK